MSTVSGARHLFLQSTKTTENKPESHHIEKHGKEIYVSPTGAKFSTGTACDIHKLPHWNTQSHTSTYNGITEGEVMMEN